jgi:hypothetical protein
MGKDTGLLFKVMGEDGRIERGRRSAGARVEMITAGE